MSLYLKSSSIYNKIMQLAIAIVFIVLLLNLWLYCYQQSKQAINDQFYHVGQQNVQQASASLAVILPDSKSLLAEMVEQLSQAESVTEIHVYDTSGQLISHSGGNQSIKDLYGLNPVTTNKSKHFVPFVKEIRGEQLLGYVRVTLDKSALTGDLMKGSKQRYDLLRLMLLLAALVGFLLTRGLNRFSRQGYRVARDSS